MNTHQVIAALVPSCIDQAMLLTVTERRRVEGHLQRWWRQQVLAWRQRNKVPELDPDPPWVTSFAKALQRFAATFHFAGGPQGLTMVAPAAVREVEQVLRYGNGVAVRLPDAVGWLVAATRSEPPAENAQPAR